LIGTLLFLILDLLYDEGYKLVAMSVLFAISIFSLKILLKSGSALFLLPNKIRRDLLCRTKLYFNRTLRFEALSAIGLCLAIWIRLSV